MEQAPTSILQWILPNILKTALNERSTFNNFQSSRNVCDFET